MRRSGRFLVVMAGVLTLAALSGAQDSQDSQSLGDVARQARQQKQQTKTAQSKDATPPKVITNEEMPSHFGGGTAAGAGSAKDKDSGREEPGTASAGKTPPDVWKAQIGSQKERVETLQREIDDLGGSIRFAPGNCVENCAQWNERQREKQVQLDRMQGQLEEQKRKLEEMQESARKQGYGSSVYDP